MTYSCLIYAKIAIVWLFMYVFRLNIAVITLVAVSFLRITIDVGLSLDVRVIGPSLSYNETMGRDNRTSTFGTLWHDRGKCKWLNASNYEFGFAWALYNATQFVGFNHLYEKIFIWDVFMHNLFEVIFFFSLSWHFPTLCMVLGKQALLENLYLGLRYDTFFQ